MRNKGTLPPFNLDIGNVYGYQIIISSKPHKVHWDALRLCGINRMFARSNVKTSNRLHLPTVEKQK